MPEKIDINKRDYGGDPANSPERLQENFERNKPFIKEGVTNYSTTLSPTQENQFRAWLQNNASSVWFDPNNTGPTAYDMRGFWKAQQEGDPRAKTGVDPNDLEQPMHFPDFWKTPYHPTFSNESQWANAATAPTWNEKDQLVTPKGQLVFDDRKEALLQMLHQLLQNKQMIQLLHDQAMNRAKEYERSLQSEH